MCLELAGAWARLAGVGACGSGPRVGLAPGMGIRTGPGIHGDAPGVVDGSDTHGIVTLVAHNAQMV